MSERSATADLWSGFRSGSTPSTLAPPAGEEPERGSSSALAVGAGLLGLGAMALFAGFAVAEVRRRRALAATGADRSRD